MEGKNNQPMSVGKILGGIAGLVAICSLAVAIAQLAQAIGSDMESRNITLTEQAQALEDKATQEAYDQASLNALEQIVNLQEQLVAGTSPESATAIAATIEVLQSTVEAQSGSTVLLPQPTATSVMVLPTAVMEAGGVDPAAMTFAVSGNLNPSFRWERGASTTSSYVLDSQTNCVEIIAGANTDHWGNNTTAPFLIHQIDGDFSASVEVFAQPLQNYQMAGIGVSSIDNVVWFRNVRFYYDGEYIGSAKSESSISQGLNGPAYNLNHFYLRLDRQGNRISSFFSSDGSVWYPIVENEPLNIGPTANFFLYALSAQNNNTFSSRFCDLQISFP